MSQVPASTPLTAASKSGSKTPITKSAITSVQISNNNDSGDSTDAKTPINIAPNFGASTLGTTTINSPFATNSVINGQISSGGATPSIVLSRPGFGGIGSNDGSSLARNNPNIPYASIPNSPSNLSNTMSGLANPPSMSTPQGQKEEKESDSGENQKQSQSQPQIQNKPQQNPSPPNMNPDSNSEELKKLQEKYNKLEEDLKKLKEEKPETEKKPETPESPKSDSKSEPDNNPKKDIDKKDLELDTPDNRILVENEFYSKLGIQIA